MDSVRTEIKRYFEQIEQDKDVPSIGSFAYSLGFYSIGELMASDNDDIRRALLKIEGALEKLLYSKDCHNGAKHILSVHYGWSTDNSVSSSPLIIVDDIPIA